jgi:hypothetical protein
MKERSKAYWFDPYGTINSIEDYGNYFSRQFNLEFESSCNSKINLSEVLKNNQYSFGILDPMFIDNDRLLNELRINSISFPIIIITANPDLFYNREYYERVLNIRAILAKPIDFLQMEFAIKSIIDKIEERSNLKNVTGVTIVENSIRIVNNSLIDLIAADPSLILKLSSRKFEELIAELFESQGYHVNITPRTRDAGIDIFAHKKDIINDAVYGIECKKYTPPNKVGRPALQRLMGAIEGHRVTAGILATTSYFTADALKYAEPLNHRLFLKDIDIIGDLIKLSK